MRPVICLLRAVNVGGHNVVEMDRLRELFVSLRLQNPRTYVQSGNVVFETAVKDLRPLAGRIQEAIGREFGFQPEVILRTREELRGAANANPFAARGDVEPAKLLVVFLQGTPPAAAVRKVHEMKTDPEEVRIRGREVFIHYPQGMGRSKLAWTAIEKALGTAGTGRNWNSVMKLLEMAR